MEPLPRRFPGSLRLAALAEGTTLLALVFVAVPVKHVLGEPGLVRIVGSVHGLAFLGYVWSLMQARSLYGWPPRWTVAALAASIVPFGTFIVLRRFRR
jgi:integral membrane protein